MATLQLCFRFGRPPAAGVGLYAGSTPVFSGQCRDGRCKSGQRQEPSSSLLRSLFKRSPGEPLCPFLAHACPVDYFLTGWRLPVSGSCEQQPSCESLNMGRVSVLSGKSLKRRPLTGNASRASSEHVLSIGRLSVFGSTSIILPTETKLRI